MDKDNCTIATTIMVLIMFFLAGHIIGFFIGSYRQAILGNERLKKFGIEIVETRVFNGEPEYSYRIVDKKKDEVNGR